jgi:GH15 family glucan-1,4-alpha-glucosidase
VTTGPIGELGLIGDTRTAALVDGRGRIVWMCLPHFDGDPVFAALVAGDDGGMFMAGPAGAATLVRRRYRPGSAVLETTWQVGGEATVVLTEGMVADVGGALFPTMCLVRRIEAHGAAADCNVGFDPRFGDERRPPRVRASRAATVCVHDGIALSLTVDRDLSIEPGAEHSLRLEPGLPVTLALTGAHRGPLTHITPDAAWGALSEDEARWLHWSRGIALAGPFAEAVERSLVTLRLLTYSPSGAPVAAPTTSLPEEPGGSRNWDYRYAWPRDASIGIGAFLGAGLVEQARAFLYWLLHASRLDRPRLPALLTVHGRRAPAERELDWDGYDGSRPVRFGNGARDQHQLDNYGWVIDAMWLLVRAGHRLYGETWRAGRAMADHVAACWREPDAGLWEVRGDPAHYVHSKLMAWLALDRALRIAGTHRTPAKQQARWAAAREAIRADVLANGVDGDRGTFVRAYGRRDVDAALLVLPLLGIEPSDSPLVTGTIDAIRQDLSAGGPLLYRYARGGDELVGREGAFLPCSFWLVQALAATGAVDRATELMAQLVDLAGPLGLYGEEADPETGAMLGNFPQAFTHAALVQAALALRDATDRAADRGRSQTRRARAR